MGTFEEATKNIILDPGIIDELKEIWEKIKGDELPQDMANIVFDFAINEGHEKAAEYFKRVLNHISQFKIKIDSTIDELAIRVLNHNINYLPAIIKEYKRRMMWHKDINLKKLSNSRIA